ncbi:MAG: hypothetical protein COZ06_03930 [Armatimonadetes bacterium CG_4_10_14_3_um_filter_66_18]|nr:hypothetical protein [Armatimonadota bacterium]OIP09256.1 MAG: hypothetical protein AUJ96_05460 [Armatimonadetes bacterium CG2_30_66_41]PIX46845.1 MAG: hypothetical protein COZ57_10095 [Armatimonadetes bacterium CG_4_8_14_3_um_filter_66_20]PIY51830.1 MAG: hypothetical protein COZ06_03930 [Armatimonadetes bacterium CG_4_10_14_3_um_filter_66_18]PIZ42464.1 MAG: hypothetical protein COY42_17515 [Armatimonadetes bacterium CG_4_10_14_0_8_um_filter_66_14]PJB71930.1 MAG: hypothetical protein CO096_
MLLAEARVVDSTHLELLSPIAVHPGRRLFVSVVQRPTADDERAEWLRLSAQGLEAAYGADEPDYPASSVRTPNPEFAGG